MISDVLKLDAIWRKIKRRLRYDCAIQYLPNTYVQTLKRTDLFKLLRANRPRGWICVSWLWSHPFTRYKRRSHSISRLKRHNYEDWL